MIQFAGRHQHDKGLPIDVRQHGLEPPQQGTFASLPPFLRGLDVLYVLRPLGEKGDACQADRGQDFGGAATCEAVKQNGARVGSGDRKRTVPIRTVCRATCAPAAAGLLDAIEAG